MTCGSRVLLIDNYDSFTYNVVQYLSQLGAEVIVKRNDVISVEECIAMAPDHVVISPGPGRPAQAGISKEIIKAFAGNVPVLGICLGHQAIVEVFGGEIVIADEIVHGKTSAIHHDFKGVFEGLPESFMGTRYHSLVASKKHLPECLLLSATAPRGHIMGVRHKTFMVEGVQFHPESVTSACGKDMLKNFLQMKGGLRESQA